MNWTDVGIALAVSENPESEIARGCIIERPKVIFNRRTGMFVMWFHLEPPDRGYTGARCGVAVTKSLSKPFRFVGSQRPNVKVWPENVPPESKRCLSKEESVSLAALDLPGGPRPYYPKHLIYRRDFEPGQMARDMTLFVDDDHTAYHLYASEDNGTLHISQLSEDYLQSSVRFIRIFPGRFHEAPCLMKWRGRYFLFTSDCTGWAPNPTRLSVADSIWGPWEELGTPCIGTGAQIANTFESQPAYILPVAGREDAFIFIADRWRPRNPSDGRYIWLPVTFQHGVPTIGWHEEWDLAHFDRRPHILCR